MKRSRHTYFYMVSISGLYFLMLLLLHSRLQVEICQTRIDYQKTHNHSVKHDKKYHYSIKTNTLMTISSQFSLNNTSPCHQRPDSTLYTFQTVADSLFYVYTAYLDKRMNTTYVRIMSVLLRGKKDNINVVCTLMGENGEIQVTAIKYEMCENHNKKYGGWIMSCPIPEDFIDPCQVTVSIVQQADLSFSSNNITLNLIKLSPDTAKTKYTVCIPPLFGEVNHSRLIEFMEFTRYFGVKKFIFYTHIIKDYQSIKVLEYYSNKSLITVIPWQLPDVIQDSQIWYHGQLIAHNDCLYRAMSLAEKLAIQDIDELIVPHDGKKFWEESLTPLLTGNVVGLGIKSAFFDTTIKGDVMAISSNRRTKIFSRFRTKVLVKPAAIFEVGIHHVSKPLFEEYEIISPEPSKVFLHHYRSCLSNYGMNCKDWVIDKTVKHKYSAVRERILEVNSIVSKLSKPEDNAQYYSYSK